LNSYNAYRKSDYYLRAGVFVGTPLPEVDQN